MTRSDLEAAAQQSEPPPALSRRCARCGEPESEHVPVHAGTSVSVVGDLRECPGFLAE